jgi:hypothetical protein
MTEDLKRRQSAAKEVEVKMLETLLQFTPAEFLKVCDVLFIARHAGTLAFEAFDPDRKSP